MEHPEELLAWAGVFVVMTGPAVLLLLLRRWLRRWWAALLVTVLVTPLIVFYSVGWVAWRLTYERVVVQGDTLVPDETGKTVPEYLMFTFAVCGAYGVLFAGFGFVLSVPLLIGWRVAHRRSFDRVTRRSTEPRQ